MNYGAQTGVSLIEVLVAVAILATGLFTLASFTGQQYQSVRNNSDRATALASAQYLIDQYRGLDITSLVSGKDPGDCSSSTPHREWQISAVSGLSDLRALSVNVCWTDVTGAVQRVALSAMIGSAVAASSGTTPTPGATPTPAPPTSAPSNACGTAYSNGASYNAGSVASNLGRNYKCKPWPYTGWCGQGGPYTPGTGSNWSEAWEDAGQCS
ncbi:type IV pilus modification PilV family protein [Chitinolyticbacter albus]|uniref:type IV pilus modification PilV family protein n=1 Tax=Chitinolyticbacter albus TaxID=2961951 RepID=UPI003570D63C